MFNSEKKTQIFNKQSLNALGNSVTVIYLYIKNLHASIHSNNHWKIQNWNRFSPISLLLK